MGIRKSRWARLKRVVKGNAQWRLELLDFVKASNIGHSSIQRYGAKPCGAKPYCRRWTMTSTAARSSEQRGDETIQLNRHGASCWLAERDSRRQAV